MSTRAYIFLRLKPSKKARTIKFSIDKLPKCMRDKCVMDSPIQDMKIPAGATYVGVYHHFDGYITGLGAELNKHYKSYDRILNLLTMGDFRTIQGKIKSYQGIGYKGVNSALFIDDETLTPEKACADISYAYLFDGKKWWVCHWQYDYERHSKSYISNWVDLSDAIEKVNEEITIRKCRLANK